MQGVSSYHLELYKNACLGKLIPSSDETITVVDNDKHILGWSRRLPDGSTTERYQVLESTDNGNKTKSSIALKMPGMFGFFTHAMLKNQIETAFNILNAGIKNNAEKLKSL